MGKYFSTRKALTVSTIVILLSSLTFVLKAARSRTDHSFATSSAQRIPRTILWAWERPTDLSFINPAEVGVAFLAETIHLRGDEVIVRPRLQTLSLPEGANVVAVARVETDLSKKLTLSKEQREHLAVALSDMARLPNVSNIQIDFDATKSEREFYRSVIIDVHRRLPEGVGLSITALASWCTDGDWLSDLPIDEAVPMLFRMGPDRGHVINRLASGEEFSAQPCRGSYGVSTDEALTNLSATKRLYVFNPRSWTEESVKAIMEKRR